MILRCLSGPVEGPEPSWGNGIVLHEKCEFLQVFHKFARFLTAFLYLVAQAQIRI